MANPSTKELIDAIRELTEELRKQRESRPVVIPASPPFDTWPLTNPQPHWIGDPPYDPCPTYPPFQITCGGAK